MFEKSQVLLIKVLGFALTSLKSFHIMIIEDERTKCFCMKVLFRTMKSDVTAGYDRKYEEIK